ncbi:hypothetical protein KIH74_22935 [Kineosporia sp. J2-2]|uniref:Uncharacterized protein n=1 Tax=Kineosporia corallincola TaxID=2835133 RepID=A0ABS5TL29_9ACTN|nr:hypothetical protein [Kineosporia corallincola]MBT0771815.1 hypothetical protein [Kineosporia corallincola]
MADYLVGQDAISVHRKTTTAGVADSVTFAGRRLTAEVTNWSAADDAVLFFTVDGSDPAVDGDRTTALGPGGIVEVEDRRRSNDTLIRLVSAVPVTYSVTAAAYR